MIHLGYAVAAGAAVLALCGPAIVPPVPILLWNATASAPIGLYAVQPTFRPTIGDLVAVMPPESLAATFAQRGYLPRGVPLLKRVAAVAGDAVCRSGPLVSVNGVAVATAHEHDSQARPLPVWTGCHVLGGDELFLLNRHPDSLDSRYFGPIPARTVLGRARPLLTGKGGDGIFFRRAATR